MKIDPLIMLDIIAQVIFDKKGMNILALDVHRFSTLTDYVIIAEGTVDRHAIAISHAIQEELQKKGERPTHVEGQREGDWVVLDYAQVMIHLFGKPGLRDKYQLEQLWKEGEIVDLNIVVNQARSYE